MSEVVICSKSYVLTNEPKHGVVRRVNKESKASLIKFFTIFGADEVLTGAAKEIAKNKEAGIVDVNKDIESQLNVLMQKYPVEATEFGFDQQEALVRHTISLATNNYFDETAFDDMTEVEIEDVFLKCKECLGGDSTSFLETYLKR